MESKYHISAKFFDSEEAQTYKNWYKAGLAGGELSINSDEGFKANVYVIELYLILKSRSIPIDYPPNGTFDGTALHKVYVAGYRRGVEYFKQEYKLETNTIYNHQEQYVKDLHACYFHTDPVTNKDKGWVYWRSHFPTTISQKGVDEFGFYAGIISELEVLKRKRPTLFANFENMCLLEKRGSNVAESAMEGTPGVTPVHSKATSLLDIWTKGQIHYEKVINFLKEPSATIGCTFLLEHDGELKWQRFDNHKAYLVAFTRICIDKGYIKNDYSGSDYKRIYLNSFNISCSERIFQPDSLNRELGSYSDVFARMP